MFTLFIFFLLTLSMSSQDGLRGVEGTHSFLITEDTQKHHQKDQEHLSSRAALLENVFSLRVQVKDAVSNQPLNQATVDVFVNYTLISSTRTGMDGSTLLSIPYKPDRALTLVASKDSYIQTPMHWKTSKMPIFSSATLSLFSQNQGNIWLFEDAVLITGKILDVVPQPKVQFPKSLLSLPDSNISLLTAYLTGPQFPAEKHNFPFTTGIIISKSGYKTIELKPVAAVSVRLLYNEGDVQVKGPIQITLPLPKSSQLKLFDTVPAWSFDRTTGAWVNCGLGIVQMENSRLVWVYIAPNLGYWIAAPFPSPAGFMGHESSLDFISYHTYFHMATLGGVLVIAIGLFGVLLCCCRGSVFKPERKHCKNTIIGAVQRKDQTTCTNSKDHLDVSFKDIEPHKSGSDTCQRFQSVSCEIKGNFKTSLEESKNLPFQICENFNGRVLVSSKPSEASLYAESGEIAPWFQNKNMALPERLVLYKQAVAVLEGPDGFSSSELASGSRKVVRYDTFTQTLPNIPPLSVIQKQVKDEALTMEALYGDPGLSINPETRCFNTLQESVSVPGALNKAVGMETLHRNQGGSEQNLQTLSKSKPLPHPKAWFVSLEGKPAAQVRHSIVDLRRSHLLTDSNDTSLDSGVDLNEQHCDQKKRKKKCLRSTSESGTSTACTPEELSLKNTFHSSIEIISNLPEDRHDADTANTHKGSECVPNPRVHRLRKAKEKSRVDKPPNS